MGDLEGARIGSYEFPTKVNSDGTEIMVVLHTEVTVTDAAGRVYDLEKLTP